MDDEWPIIFNSNHLRRRRARLLQLRDNFPNFVSFVDTLEHFELANAEMDIELVESRNCAVGNSVSSLLDLASRAVAQHVSCEMLENHDPPLDEALLRKVAFWSFPQDEQKIKAYAMVMPEAQWNHGISLVKDYKIREMWQIGFMLTAYIVKFTSAQPDGTSDIRVSMTFERQRIITSSCSECQNQLWCAHIVAATVYRIRNAHKVPVHAPMTETLSTLDRNQLQKLLQYAVQEDPAGILGKVFKHLDEIRDVGSDMSTLHGAPDPTFGALRDTRTMWHLSMDWLERSLNQDLQDMCNHRLWSFHSSENNTFYPTTYDVAKKRKSKMYPYIGLAVELARQEELDSAADVMIKTCEVVVSKMQAAGSRLECPHFARFVRDLAQYFTHLLLHPRLTPAIRHKLLAAAHVLHSDSCKLDFKVEDSQWAELPSVMHTRMFASPKNKETTVHWSPFEEPLVIEEVGQWPGDLLALIEGRIPVEQSTYDEDVTVMLARMETLFHFESGDAAGKIARLGAKIVRKLLPLVQEDTILGAYLTQLAEDDLDLLGLLQRSAGLPVTSAPVVADDAVEYTNVKGKSRKRSSKGKRPAKRARKDKVGSARQLTQGQLAYSMLYVLRRLISANQLSEGAPYENPALLVGFCLLGLELSRHRVVAPRGTISELEHNWVTVTEYFIVQHLSSAIPSSLASDGASTSTSVGSAADGAMSLYLAALRAVGCDFYAGTFPLIMLDALLTVFSRNESLQQRHAGDVVEVCARVLNDVNGAMQRFTLPVSSWVDLCIDASLVEPKLKDLVLKKLHHVLQTFLAQINMSCREHISLLLKVIQQFEAVDNAPLLHLTSRSLRQHLTKLQQSTPAVEATVGVVLHTLEKAKVFYLGLDSEEAARRMEKEFLVTLINHLGLDGLRLLVGRWDGPLKCREIRELVVSFEPQIRAAGGTVPRDVVALLHEFFASRCQHDEDACDLLRFFVTRDDNWYLAVRAIVENARFYHPNTFFELARQEYQHTISASSSLSSSNVTSTAAEGPASTGSFDIVLSFLEKGFECFQKGYDYCHPLTSNAKTMQYVDWMCGAFVGGGSFDGTASGAAGGNIARIVQLVNERARGSPDFILRMLHNMERSGPAASCYAEPLRAGLVLAYKEHFDYKVYQSSHSAYAAVINDMHRARLVCKQYVPNGEADFDAVVVDHVRTVHRSKKKLVKMLASEFGSGRPLGTESSV